MADIDVGVGKIRQFVHVFEVGEDFYQLLEEKHRDAKHYRAFEKSLEQKNPLRPVMDASNAVVYNTDGMGYQKLQELLDRCNIPNAVYQENATGKTVVAIPKQYAPQANLIFAKEREMTAQREGNDGKQLQPVEQKFVQKMAENSAPNMTPSTLATNALTSGNVTAYETIGGAHLGWQARLQQQGIPYTIVENTQKGTHLISVDSVYTQQCDQIHRELEISPTTLNRSAFMQANLGKYIIEHEGITMAQARDISRQLRGSGFGYNLQRHNDNTYTLRYNAEHSQYITAAAVSSIIKTGGARGPSIESHASQIDAIANNAVDRAASGEPCVIRDAMHPERTFTIDKTGLRDAQNKLIVGRQDQNFEAYVYATTSEMKAPMVKGVDKITGIENIFTQDEIRAAKEGAALANPEDACIYASQLACMHLASSGSAVNAYNDAASACSTMANGIEEDRYRYSPAELYHEILGGTDLSNVPPAVSQFIDEVNTLSAEERLALGTSLHEISTQLQSMRQSTERTTRIVGIQDMDLATIKTALDRSEQHGMDSSMQRDAWSNGSRNDSSGVMPIGEDDL